MLHAQEGGWTAYIARQDEGKLLIEGYRLKDGKLDVAGTNGGKCLKD